MADEIKHWERVLLDDAAGEVDGPDGESGDPEPRVSPPTPLAPATAEASLDD